MPAAFLAMVAVSRATAQRVPADLEVRIGSRAILVHPAGVGSALQCRGQPGLLREALDGARELELTGTERRIAMLLDELGDGPAAESE